MIPYRTLRRLWVCLLPCLAAPLWMAGVAAQVQAALPDGFEDGLVASVPFPTAMAATPDGRLLIASQYGQLYVYQHGALVEGPALDLGSDACAYRERGLVGVAVDPEFAANRFVYVGYSFNKFGNCDEVGPSGPVGRVSRFELTDGNLVARDSEYVLLDNIPSPIGLHNLGDVKFGNDGYLYVSVGDGGCDYAGDSGCFTSNDAASDRHALVGKVLRITRTGDIPPGNPFTGPGTVRCSADGAAQPGLACQEIFATGLRNPWRLAFDPNAPGTRFFINDVGQDTWEEINEGIAGADYGWNAREGSCAIGSTTDCSPVPPPGLTNPIFSYDRRDECASITGGAFVPNGAWPAEFDNAYIFSDYVCGTIFRLVRASDGSVTRETFLAGLGSSSATGLSFFPHEGRVALYYTTYANGGEVRRIAYTAGGNRAPNAVLAAAPLSGPTPLVVDFDGRGSSDPDGDALSYTWDFGDATPSGSGVAVRHTYSTPGTYTATLRVGDPAGASSTRTVRIDAGNTPPQPEILTPRADHRFAVGESIVLQGRAADAEDGELPDAALTWRVVLHHNTHTHGFLPSTTGNLVAFQAPGPENLQAAATSYLEVQLTATDSHGRTATVTQALMPRTAALQFLAEPSGAMLRIDNEWVTAPVSFTSWVNYGVSVEAPSQLGPDGAPLVFASWSDGGGAAHVIATPAASAAYTASFTRQTGAGARIATASSVEGSAYAAAHAIDGNPDTRWSSQFSDPQWITVDLGATADIARVVLHWEAAHARAYMIQVSDDGVAWTTVFQTTTGSDGVQDIGGLGARGRYVRMYGTVRGTEWGYSLWEFQVFGSAAASSAAFGGTPVALPGLLEAENFDHGGQGMAYLDDSAGNSGSQYRSTDVDLEGTSDTGGGYNVGWMAPGEWLKYTVNVTTAGTYTIEARVAAAANGGTFHIEVNGVDETGPLIIPNTGGWQNWTTVSKAGVALDAGQQVWTLKIDGAGNTGVVGNLNYLRIASGSTSSNPAPFTGGPFPLPGTVQAENFDNGGQGVAYADATTGNEGGAYRTTDVDIADAIDTGDGYTLGWVGAGEWVQYTVTVGTAGTYDIEARVASAGAGGTFRIEVNGVDKTGPITVPDTGGWQNWTTIRKTGVSLGAGGQVWRVVMLTDGATGAVGNFNWFRVASAAPSAALLRAPFLQQVNAGSAIVVWTTREPGTAEVLRSGGRSIPLGGGRHPRVPDGADRSSPS